MAHRTHRIALLVRLTEEAISLTHAASATICKLAPSTRKCVAEANLAKTAMWVPSDVTQMMQVATMPMKMKKTSRTIKQSCFTKHSIKCPSIRLACRQLATSLRKINISRQQVQTKVRFVQHQWTASTSSKSALRSVPSPQLLANLLRDRSSWRSALTRRKRYRRRIRYQKSSKSLSQSRAWLPKSQGHSQQPWRTKRTLCVSRTSPDVK